VYENYSLVLVSESGETKGTVSSLGSKGDPKKDGGINGFEFRALYGYRRIQGEEKSKRRMSRKPLEKKEKRNQYEIREENHREEREENHRHEIEETS